MSNKNKMSSEYKIGKLFCQEMMAMGTGPRSVDYVRKQMNVAKFILSKMMTSKEAV